MTVQLTEASTGLYSRRGFMKRAGVGIATLAALAATAGRLGGDQRLDQPLSGSGSIFEPRREDLLRYWKKRLGRFRLR